MDFDKRIHEIPRADIHRFGLRLADLLYIISFTDFLVPIIQGVLCSA